MGESRMYTRRADPAALLRRRERAPLPGSYQANGAAIREARQRRLWRQADLGAALGISQVAVCRLEGEHYWINRHMAEQIAIALLGDPARWPRFVQPTAGEEMSGVA